MDRQCILHITFPRQPPFVLSRRGWGEFKVQLTLRFKDQRNKPIRLLHPLVLSRQDDALALTGLWRLGKLSVFIHIYILILIISLCLHLVALASMCRY